MKLKDQNLNKNKVRRMYETRSLCIDLNNIPNLKMRHMYYTGFVFYTLYFSNCRLAVAIKCSRCHDGRYKSNNDLNSAQNMTLIVLGYYKIRKKNLKHNASFNLSISFKVELGACGGFQCCCN